MSISVLVVDDSALIRQVLSATLIKDGDIEVVGTAEDPIVARRKIKELNPDVVTLDIEMPNMNGLEFLSKLMRLRPTPVVMVSTLTHKGASETMLALELGAVDFVGKPNHDLEGGMEQFGAEIRQKVRFAAQSDVRGQAMRESVTVRPVKAVASGSYASGALIAIGASTGGVDAIRKVLVNMPENSPPVVVAQHMPANFTERFAERLDQQVDMKVVEAQDGLPIRAGHVYIAKGGHHLRVENSSGSLKCSVTDDATISGHRPSVDALFRSVAKVVGPKAVGAILTGMGKDGAEGLLEMKKAGAHTLGQSKDSALVYGMPRVAMEIGAVDEQASVEEIAEKLLSGLQGRQSAA